MILKTRPNRTMVCLILIALLVPAHVQTFRNQRRSPTYDTNDWIPVAKSCPSCHDLATSESNRVAKTYQPTTKLFNINQSNFKRDVNQRPFQIPLNPLAYTSDFIDYDNQRTGASKNFAIQPSMQLSAPNLPNGNTHFYSNLNGFNGNLFNGLAAPLISRLPNYQPQPMFQPTARPIHLPAPFQSYHLSQPHEDFRLLQNILNNGPGMPSTNAQEFVKFHSIQQSNLSDIVITTPRNGLDEAGKGNNDQENGRNIIENGRVENGKIESGRVESGRVENGRVESGRVENGRVENSQNNLIENYRNNDDATIDSSTVRTTATSVDSRISDYSSTRRYVDVSTPKEDIQLVYIPYNQLNNRNQPSQPEPKYIYTTTTERQNSLESTPKKYHNLKPHQPPLAIFMNGSGKNQVSVADLVNSLGYTKKIDILDQVLDDMPSVFIGPANMKQPKGYAKFDLPYLSNIVAKRPQRKVEELPFFVAPVSYETPKGYFKIDFPAPHVGSVVYREKHDALNTGENLIKNNENTKNAGNYIQNEQLPVAQAQFFTPKPRYPTTASPFDINGGFYDSISTYYRPEATYTPPSFHTGGAFHQFNTPGNSFRPTNVPNQDNGFLSNYTNFVDDAANRKLPTFVPTNQPNTYYDQFDPKHKVESTFFEYRPSTVAPFVQTPDPYRNQQAYNQFVGFNQPDFGLAQGAKLVNQYRGNPEVQQEVGEIKKPEMNQRFKTKQKPELKKAKPENGQSVKQTHQEFSFNQEFNNQGFDKQKPKIESVKATVFTPEILQNPIKNGQEMFGNTQQYFAPSTPYYPTVYSSTPFPYMSGLSGAIGSDGGQSGSGQFGSGQSISGHSTPSGQSGSGQFGSEQFGSGQADSRPFVSGQSNSKPSISGQFISGQSISGQSLSEQSISGHSTPSGQSISGYPTPSRYSTPSGYSTTSGYSTPSVHSTPSGYSTPSEHSPSEHTPSRYSTPSKHSISGHSTPSAHSTPSKHSTPSVYQTPSGHSQSGHSSSLSPAQQINLSQFTTGLKHQEQLYLPESVNGLESIGNQGNVGISSGVDSNRGTIREYYEQSSEQSTTESPRKRRPIVRNQNENRNEVQPDRASPMRQRFRTRGRQTTAKPVEKQTNRPQEEYVEPEIITADNVGNEEYVRYNVPSRTFAQEKPGVVEEVKTTPKPIRGRNRSRSRYTTERPTSTAATNERRSTTTQALESYGLKSEYDNDDALQNFRNVIEQVSRERNQEAIRERYTERKQEATSERTSGRPETYESNFDTFPTSPSHAFTASSTQSSVSVTPEPVRTTQQPIVRTTQPTRSSTVGKTDGVRYRPKLRMRKPTTERTVKVTKEVEEKTVDRSKYRESTSNRKINVNRGKLHFTAVNTDDRPSEANESDNYPAPFLQAQKQRTKTKTSHHDLASLSSDSIQQIHTDDQLNQEATSEESLRVTPLKEQSTERGLMDQIYEEMGYLRGYFQTGPADVPKPEADKKVEKGEKNEKTEKKSDRSGKKRGYWRKVRVRPTDVLESAESQVNSQLLNQLDLGKARKVYPGKIAETEKREEERLIAAEESVMNVLEKDSVTDTTQSVQEPTEETWETTDVPETTVETTKAAETTRVFATTKTSTYTEITRVPETTRPVETTKTPVVDVTTGRPEVTSSDESDSTVNQYVTTPSTVDEKPKEEAVVDEQDNNQSNATKSIVADVLELLEETITEKLNPDDNQTKSLGSTDDDFFELESTTVSVVEPSTDSSSESLRHVFEAGSDVKIGSSSGPGLRDVTRDLNVNHVNHVTRTSTSTEISHETEICFRGRCVKSVERDNSTV